MGRLQWAQGRGDSAFAALVVGGIAVALGGAALFGMVAHTWTPFLPQRGAGASPFDDIARGSLPSPKTDRRRHSIPFDPRPDEFQTAAAGSLGAAPVPTDSLAPREFVVASAGPAPVAEPKRVEAEPLDIAYREQESSRPMMAHAMLVEPPAIHAMVPIAALDPRPVVIRVADVKVVGAGSGKAMQTELRIVQSPPGEANHVKAKPVRPAAPKVAQAKPAPTKAAETKPAPMKVAEAKPALMKLAETKPVVTRVPETRSAPVKMVETKPAPKAAVAPRIELRPVALKVAAVKPPEVQRIETKRVAETRAAETRRAEARRAAEVKALEARFAETKRAAETKQAEAKLAESKRAAEMKAAEERLADLKRAADEKAAEERLAESQRAFETKAAEARLAETRRAVENTLAEARRAEARLAETKRAVEVTLAQAKPAVETRVSSTRTLPRYQYDSCESCGTVSAVVLRSQEYGPRKWEVRVNFPDGMQRIFHYPTDPGFSSGERVRFEAGMLTRPYPRRPGAYSPA